MAIRDSAGRRLPVLKGRQVIKALRRLGFVESRDARRRFCHSDGRSVLVTATGDITGGPLHHIARQARVPVEALHDPDRFHND